MRYIILILGLLSTLMLISSIYYKSKFDNSNSALIKLESIREIELAELRWESERQRALMKGLDEKREKITARYQGYYNLVHNSCDEKMSAIDEVQRIFYER